ncbi:MAG TPA: hypothetical protein VI653_24985, partial [Steroidobacteraceae bacterium]
YSPEVSHTVGYFGTPLYVRVELQERDRFVDLLRHVSQQYATACAHDDSCRIALEMGRPGFIFNPAFNWIPKDFNMHPDGSAEELPVPEGCTLAPYPLEVMPRHEWDGEPRIDLSDSTDGLVGDLGYRADRFTAATLARFGRNLLHFAATMVGEPQTPVNAVSYER